MSDPQFYWDERAYWGEVSVTFFSVEEIDIQKLHHQEDVVFRWLAARRDYPFDKAPAPEVEPSIMQRCVREFIRSNPGFAL